MAVVVPTYNRPQKVRELLKSLTEQTVSPGRIIIVDGGKTIEDEVLAFKGYLPVEYHRCEPPGQIRQRNFGISLLEQSTPLVASFDDDIVLEPNALSAMIEFWNNCTEDPAGVAFNIVNNPKHRHSRIKGLLNMSVNEEGKVLKSSYNTGFGNVDKDLRVQFVYGGATVWKLEVLEKFPHREIKSKWATCEDLIYSYPISKLFPLYVCANARVRHEHVFSNQKDPLAKYRGTNSLLWRLYFIESNPEFSASLYLFQQAMIVPWRFIHGLLTQKSEEIKYGYGQAEGILRGMYCKLKKKSIYSLINEEDRD
jgi:glycosyltransferase involved in cell wall biosynthesis